MRRSLQIPREIPTWHVSRKKLITAIYLYIAKLNPQGEKEWVKGNAYPGRATALTLTPDNTVIVAGYFGDYLSFDNFFLARGRPRAIASLQNSPQMANASTCSASTVRVSTTFGAIPWENY